MTDIKQMVELGGLQQKIHIKSADEKNPVLLFLHGGPGVCNRHSIMTDHADLTDTFTIVAWDQRGSGGSFKGVKAETLTIN
ncbi:MAG: alpha/beta hydrolase, partial [Oscillospiraceae bacterium]